MLSLREDIFADHSKEAFDGVLDQHARIIRAETVSDAGRRLYWYDRPDLGSVLFSHYRRRPPQSLITVMVAEI
jgi:hypothetical protein